MVCVSIWYYVAYTVVWHCTWYCLAQVSSFYSSAEMHETFCLFVINLTLSFFLNMRLAVAPFKHLQHILYTGRIILPTALFSQIVLFHWQAFSTVYPPDRLWIVNRSISGAQTVNLSPPIQYSVSVWASTSCARMLIGPLAGLFALSLAVVGQRVNEDPEWYLASVGGV